MKAVKHCLALVVGAVIFAAADGCAGQSVPSPAVARPPDVRYEPTPHNVVTAMLQLGEVGEKDVVYDLGCGDGRIVIAAVQRFGARGVCVDIDPERIRESRANAEQVGVADRIVFLEQDLFATNLSNATVVTLFLSSAVNLRVRSKLWRELRPGTRVVSYVHDMGDWAPQQVRAVQGTHGERQVYLWTIPAARDKRP